MTQRLRLAWAALAALAIFALALWAGGETKRARALDRPVDWPARTLETIADIDVPRSGTAGTTTPDSVAARFAQARPPGSRKTSPPSQKRVAPGAAGAKATTPASPGDMFVDGVPRGSFEAPPRKNDATRGSHANDGA